MPTKRHTGGTVTRIRLEEASTGRCPHCQRVIQASDLYCRFCGEETRAPAPGAAARQRQRRIAPGPVLGSPPRRLAVAAIQGMRRQWAQQASLPGRALLLLVTGLFLLCPFSALLGAAALSTGGAPASFEAQLGSYVPRNGLLPNITATPTRTRTPSATPTLTPTETKPPSPTPKPTDTARPTQRPTVKPPTVKPPTAKPPPATSAPAPTVESARPAGVTARCCDGSYSRARSRHGACSYHGGVCEWFITPE